MLLVACASGPRTPVYDDPHLLFQDDFANPTSGWDAYADAEKTTNYDNGQYVIAVDTANVLIWASPHLNFTDTTLKADATYLAGPANNEYGLMCRYTRHGDGSHSFYFFVISSDGYYALGKVIKNERTILSPTSGEFQASDLIPLEATTPHRLTATCQGQHLALTLNGTELGAFDDADLTQGDVGVLAGSFDETGVKIHFDNFEVRKP